MNAGLRALVIAGAGLAALFDPVPTPQEDDPVYVDEEKKEFLDKIERCRKASDWKALFDLQAQAAHPKKAHKLVRLPGPDARFIGLIEHLNRQFANLPDEALAYYRGQFDGAARREFELSRAAGDRAGLEKVVDTWFYSTKTDEALDVLANLHVEEGRLSLAIHCWSRLLYHYPDSEIPRAVTAARLARAATESGHEAALEGVRRYAQERELTGEVIVGDTAVSLPAFLKDLAVEPVAGSGLAPREPSIMPPGGPQDFRLTGVRPEIRRWSADLSTGPDTQRRGATSVSDFPFMPAYARIDDHEMVVYTNGVRISVIDPALASTERPEEAVYFSYPASGENLPRPQTPADWRGGFISWVRPYIGATVDGDLAFATLFSGKRSRENPGPGGGMPMADTLYGTMRLVCLNLRTQQVLWDTDFGEPGVQLRKLEFWERNFSFAGPPLVRGDRVYMGVGTSPLGEEESRVVCFDRRTGLPLWDRYLGSVANTRPMWERQGTFFSRLTMLEEDRGVLLAHSNIGIVSALDAVTGHVRWLTKYPRTVSAGNMGQSVAFSRPASPLVVYRGKIYALPQDAAELLVVDAVTGSIQKEVAKPDTALVGQRQWRDFQRLVGRMGDFLVFGCAGVDSCIYNTTTNLFHGLTWTNTGGTGRGTIDGETLYLPCVDAGKGGLGIFHGQRNWNAFERSTIWWPLGESGKGEGGNVIRGGNYLIFASATRVSIYTDLEVVRAEYRRRLEQSPPNPAAWLDYGKLMRSPGNERWSEAARAYLNFIDAVQGDPEWMGRAREVRTELHGIFLKLGAESAGRRLHVDAAAHFASARDFAWDGPTLIEATRQLAGACESAAESQADPAQRRSWARRAVEEYHELIRRSPPGFVRPGDAMHWVPIARYASSRIAALVAKHGPDAYEGVARKAADDLRKAGKNPAALRALADLYPDSPAALEAIDRIAETAAAQGKWVKVAAALRDKRSRLGPRWTPAHQKRLHEALEKAGDAERLALEADRMAARFDSSSKLGPDEASPTIAEYVAKVRATAAALKGRPVESPPGSTATLSTWEPTTEASGPYQLPVGWDLVIPGGLEPARWPVDLEFFARGSAVELWNIRSKKRQWSASHPGSWTGIVFSEGVRVEEIIDDSPGARAGLESGDVILSVDGAPVRTEDFDLATEGRAPGSRLAIVYKRGDETRRADLTTAAWPASWRPGIVGAVFTADGSVAVAWEDLVAAFDPADGRPLWVSRPCRDRFTLRAIHAAGDRILVHEHFAPSRGRSSLRQIDHASPKMPAPEDHHSRVLALDDADGGALWAVGLKFEAATAAHHSVQFVGRPLDSHAGLIVTGGQSTMRAVELVAVAAEDGKESPKHPLAGPGAPAGTTWSVDPATGTVWVIEAAIRNKARLRSFVRPDYARGPEIPLDGNVDPGATAFGLAANENSVAVVSFSHSPTPPRLAVFSLRDGALIAATKGTDGPLKDRLMPGYVGRQPIRRLLPGVLTMEPDGLVLLYNEVKPAGGVATAVRRASLTALRVADGGFRQEWDAITPTLTPEALLESEFLTVHAGPKGLFVTTHRGIPPGRTEEASVLAFHSRKEEGKVRKQFDDLVVPVDSLGNRLNPVTVHKGRLFLQRKGGLEILGD